MSEENQTHNTPQKSGDNEPAGQSQSPPRQPPRRGGVLAVVALLLSLLVAGAAGGAAYYLHLQLAELERQAQTRASESALETLAEELRQETGALREKMDTLGGRTSSQTENLAQFREELQRLRENQNGLEKRMDHFAKLAESRRYEWARTEAAYLASVAIARVELHRDVDSALQALKEADELLAGFGGRTVDARQGINRAIEALLDVERPDLVALSDRLLGLSASIPDLPLRGQPQVQRLDERTDTASPTPSADGWSAAVQRAWSRFKASLSELVVITRAEDQPPLISPEQRYALTQNLQLQIAAARAALVRQQPELYRDSLRQAQRWLSRYYDTDRTAVRTAHDELQALADARLAAELPKLRPMLQPLLGPGQGGGDDA